MKTQEELTKLRNISSQKQSSLNALLSEKQSLNSTISQYRSLNQISKHEYDQSLQKLQDVEAEISQHNQSIADSEFNIKVFEDKLSAISNFEGFMEDMESILSEYTKIEGKKIDTSTMMVKELPKNEILNSELSKEVCKKKCLEAFEKLLIKLDDVNAVDSEGRTLLMHALSNGFFPAVDILFSNPNIDFNITDNNGCNALMYACAMPHIGYIERIIDATDNVNLGNEQAGDTALHLLLKNTGMDSVFSDEINFIKQAAGDASNDLYFTGTLVVAGNLTINGNAGGLRPDGYSLNQYKSLLICRQLNAQGADFSVLNNGGLSPYFYLCRNKQEYLANCLEDEGILDLNLLDENGFQGAAGKLLLKDHAALQDFIDNHPNCLEDGDANGDTLLHFAVQMKDLSLVQLIMNSGANQNIKNITNGLTPLFLACSIKEKEIVKYLIEQSPDLSIVDNSGFDSLLWSLELRDMEVIQELISEGADINYQDKLGRTAVYWSCLYGYEDMLKGLIEKGAKHDIPNNQGFYPIHGATHHGRTKIIDILLANDVSINTQSKFQGLTPLNYACARKQTDVAKYLLKQSPDLSIVNNNGFDSLLWSLELRDMEIIQELISKGADINYQDKLGRTAVYWSCLYGYEDMLRGLIEEGAKHDIPDNQGFYPIHSAAEKGFLDVVKLLASYYNVDIFSQGNIKTTPLYIAAQNGHSEMIEWLASKGANIDVKGSNGMTAFFTSVVNERFESVIVLQKLGADTNITNSDGALPIHMAAQSGNVDMIKLILNNNVNITTDNSYKITPLWIACQNGHLDAVKFLLENGADTSLSRLDNGVPPVCIAVRNKHINIVKQLLEKGNIDLSTQDKDGKTPIDYAKEYCPETLEYLSLDSFIKDSASTNTSIHSSIFDDSQSLLASHATSETEIMGDQDSYSII